MEIDFPAQHLAVHNVRKQNYFAAGSPLNHNVPGGSLLQGAEDPVHCLMETGVVQRFE